MTLINKMNKNLLSFNTLFLILISFAVFLYVALNLFYHPSIDDILQRATQLSFLGVTMFSPEPKEHAYITMLFVLLPVAALLYDRYLSDTVANNKLLISSELAIERIVLWIFFTTIILTFLSSNGTYHYLNLYLLQHDIWIGNYYFIILFIATLLLFLVKNSRMVNVLSYLLSFALIAYTFYFAKTVHFPAEFAGHFNAVFYSQLVVDKLQTPLLVDGFKNTYGLYPMFLEPVYKAIGLTFDNSRDTMIVILCVSYLFLFLFLKEALKSRIMSLLLLTAVIYYNKYYFADEYYQYFPLRTIFPYAILFLSALYYRKRHASLFILISVLSTLAVLWQPDSGIVTLLMWVIYVSYLEYQGKDWSWVRDVFKKTATIIGIAVATLLTFKLIIYIVYGQSPQLSELFITIHLFNDLGFWLIKMDTIHPNKAYLLFIFMAIAFIFTQSNNKKPYLLLFLLWSAGSFMYYLGRSHPLTFSSIIMNILILSVVMYEAFRQSPDFKASTLATILNASNKFVIAFLVTSLPFYIYYKPYPSIDPASATTDIDFIDHRIADGERFVLLDTEKEGYIYALTNTLPAYKTGIIDLFLRKDLDDLFKVMESGRYKIISAISLPEGAIRERLKKEYDVVAVSPHGLYTQWTRKPAYFHTERSLGLEKNETSQWQWFGSTAVIRYGTKKIDKNDISFDLQSLTNRSVLISINGRKYQEVILKAGKVAHIVIQSNFLEPATTVYLHSEQPLVHSPEPKDPRLLGFRIIDLKLLTKHKSSLTP